jgi:hypothetical protein
MDINNPRTKEEWQRYFDQFSVEEIISKAKACNKNAYVREWIRQGYTLDEVEDIFTMMGVIILQGGYKPPVGNAYDLQVLARRSMANLDSIPTLEEIGDQD